MCELRTYDSAIKSQILSSGAVQPKVGLTAVGTDAAVVSHSIVSAARVYSPVK